MLLESLGREPLHRGLSWVCRAELRPNLGLQSEGASGESPILECIVGKSRAGGAFLRFAVDLLDAASMPGLFALVPVLTIGARSKQTARSHIECLSDSPRTALRRFLETSWGVWGASSQAQWRF